MSAYRAFSAWSWSIVFGSILTASCASDSDPATERDQTQSNHLAAAPIETEAITAKQIAYQFAIYYLAEPAKDPLAELKTLLRPPSKFQLVDDMPDSVARPCIEANLVREVNNSYPPPDLQALKYFGRGLSREQAEGLQKSKLVLIVDFGYGNEHADDGLHSAAKLIDSLARDADGLIWDQESREVFTPNSWRERRIDGWTQPPDVSKHITIHAYKKDNYVRAITLGMVKFGLPDIVVEKFSWSRNDHISILINLFAQALGEGGTCNVPGEFDLDIRAIKNASVREAQLTTLKANATAIAPLSLKKGTWEEGDPTNRLIEITFDRCPGPDVHARQEQMLSNLFRSQDTATAIEHNEELAAASRQARTKLPALQKEFNNGLAPGDFIYVKAPFPTPSGGREWMWVEVTTWQGNTIRGLLGNDPVEIPNLHAGQEVTVNQEDVFDYIRQRSDGTQEGNETSKVIQKINEGR